jgi:hypothetical protein
MHFNLSIREVGVESIDDCIWKKFDNLTLSTKDDFIKLNLNKLWAYLNHIT